MNTDFSPNLFLDSYVAERLPQMQPGEFETLGDEPSIAIDRRYIPLKDPAHT